MENLLWYAGTMVVLYVIVRLWIQPSALDDELDEIITSEKYKAKGRFEP